MSSNLRVYSKHDNTVRGILYCYDRPVSGGDIWRTFTSLPDPDKRTVSRSTVANILNRFRGYDEIEGQYERGYCRSAITLTAEGLEAYYLSFLEHGKNNLGAHLELETTVNSAEAAKSRTLVLASRVIEFADQLRQLNRAATE